MADVIALLTALAFSFVCFLGTNFYTLGNTEQSILLSTIIFLLLSGTALGAKLLKRTSSNFKTCFIWEMILLVLFSILTAYFTYSPFSHYFVVSDQKQVIQSKLTASIQQAADMYPEYELYAQKRETIYIGKLRSVVMAKHVSPGVYSDYDFKSSGGSDNKQIDSKMFTLHADLFPSNYGKKKTADSTWLADSRRIVNEWKAIGIADVIKNVEQNSKDWKTELVRLSRIREKGENANDFDYILSFNDVKTHFTTPDKPTPLSIGLAIIAYFLMLLPWIVTKRKGGKSGDILGLFGLGKSAADNEL
ncbi:hypothetical protein Q767_10630 [Flavobacterium enshiense DK69]|uniref:Uncharacterized protein n=1 Tax=Flavobacterium enshiense DK69 TaxID=1107311 RepID=A0A0A2MTL6_9FLAO|nr:hypothetical protein Q767_10630 [Flavobacterium enshiense DK69]